MAPAGPAKRWREIDALLTEALDIPRPARQDFVRERTTGDPDLRRAVEDLLRAEEEAGEFLERPIDLRSQTWFEASSEFLAALRPGLPAEAREGQAIGAWRVVRELGRGGMAVVYLAERAEGGFDQHGALKILRSDLHGDIVERFLAERQILSDLAHPNISRLLDGGSTAAGHPYLVMEAVRGQPLTDYCDAHLLTITERLDLFRDVLDAVQYAHASLVVHRDLKPSNILVTDEGRVKLLDFGIAGILNPDGRATEDAETRRLLLTPEYASPEQVAGKRITTASDVYQLGLILYRLLSGARPYDVRASSRAELEASVLDSRPEPPSQAVLRSDDATLVADRRRSTPRRLAARLRGDLDAIVLKAIRKQPEERYASVAEFEADLGRHLENRPVPAVGSSRPYRIRKYLRRNRWAAPAAAAALIGTFAYVMVQRAHERQLQFERNVARAEASRAEAVKNFLVDVFQSADPWESSDPELAREIRVRDALAIGAERARLELEDQPEIRAELLAAIGGSFHRLGLQEDARPLLEEAVSIERSPGTRADPVRATGFLLQLGRALREMDRLDTARVVLTEAADLGRTLPAPDDTAEASALLALANLEVAAGDYFAAERRAHRADSLLSRTDPDPDLRIRGLHILALIYPQLDRLDDAERVARRALDEALAAYGEDSPRTAPVLIRLASVLSARGRAEAAIPILRDAARTLENALGPEHDETLSTINNLAVGFTATGDYARADSVFRRLLEIRTAKSGAWDRDVADALQNLASNSYQWGRLDSAAGYAERAHRIYQAVLDPGHPRIAFPLLTLTAIHLDRRGFVEAERSAAEAHRILSSALPEGNYVVAMAECRLGRALLGQGRLGEAESRLRPSVAVVSESTELSDPYRRECLAAFADVLEATGRTPDAEPYRTAAAALSD